MSVDKEAVLTHEAPIRLSPVFPAAISLSEQPQLAKPLPIIRAKNGLQPPDDSQPALPAPPPPPSTQRIGNRRYSMGVGFKGLTKRRRRANSDSLSESVLPSHFLLGGNIFDPLNLNSLLDEEVNRWGGYWWIHSEINITSLLQDLTLTPPLCSSPFLQNNQSGDTKVLTPAVTGRRPRRDPGASWHHWSSEPEGRGKGGWGWTRGPAVPTEVQEEAQDPTPQSRRRGRRRRQGGGSSAAVSPHRWIQRWDTCSFTDTRWTSRKLQQLTQ